MVCGAFFFLVGVFFGIVFCYIRDIFRSRVLS